MPSAPRGLIQERFTDDTQSIQIACDQNPDYGTPFLVAPGIWWVRLPVASHLQAVNVYLLEDGEELTLVDTGVKSTECREALKAALSHPDIESYQLTKVIVTHYHPDHIGLAGELARDGAQLWTSRTTWLNSQVLSGNKQLLPLPPEVTFMQRAGLTGIELEAFRRRAANRYSALVAPPPDHFIPLVDGQTLAIGRRTWRVVMSYGHAAEHISMWSDDCVVSGDQILPSISSNLTVPYTESESDVIGEWLRSCRRLMQFANNESLCLPGHQRPFYGIRTRLTQIDENIRKTLERLHAIATQPIAAIECVERVYGRTVANDERRLLLPEVVGMLNHLYFHGLLERSTDQEGVFRYVASSSKTARWGALKKEKSSLDSGDPNALPSPLQPLANNYAVQFDEPSVDESTNPVESRSEYLESTIGSRFSRLLVVAALVLIGGGVYWNWKDVSANAQEVIQAYIKPKLQHDPHRPTVAAVVPVETIEVVMQTQAEVPGNLLGSLSPAVQARSDSIESVSLKRSLLSAVTALKPIRSWRDSTPIFSVRTSRLCRHNTVQQKQNYQSLSRAPGLRRLRVRVLK